jgi:thiol-disulfide isomerase/thioredoxin
MKEYKTVLIAAGLLVLYFGVRYIYFIPKYKAGEKISSFNHTLADGTQFTLSKLEGQYVLLQFWGSWCGPCRKDNPLLVQLYKSFADKKFKEAEGFTIVSIGLEKNKENWQKAIVNDNMIWPYHILQEEGLSSSLALEYGVKEIPTKYLLGPDGKVLLTNPSAEEIAAILRDKVL